MSETVSEPVFDEAAELAAYDAEQSETEASAPAPAPEAAPEADRGEGQRVPLAVLMREREAARLAKEESARLRETLEAGNKRLEMLVQQWQQQNPPRPAEPVPDINTDPVGYFQRQLAETQRELAEVKGFKQQFEQQGQQLSQEQQFINRYSADAHQFVAKAPDFPQAYEYLKESLVREAMEAGFSPQEAIADLQHRERVVAAKAFQDGRSPAEAIYKLAKARGFAPKPDAAAKMDAMQRGQVAAKSTAAPGGRGRYDGLTVEALSNMPTKEFNELLAKAPHVVDRLLGKGA